MTQPTNTDNKKTRFDRSSTRVLFLGSYLQVKTYVQSREPTEGR